jgi:hypothetical protein
MSQMKPLQGGKFVPEIWSKNIIDKFIQTMTNQAMTNQLYGMPMPCPLSKEIALDAIRELTIKHPEKHLIEILYDIVHENLDQQDTAFAQQLTQLVCSESSSCKPDSSSS